MRGYPKYQDTGLDWLGKVPAHWSLGKLGTCFSERNEKVSDTEYPALSVTKNGIVPQMEHVAKTDAGDNRKKVCKNDFVINSRSDRKGSAGVSDYEGSVSLISTVLEPRFYLPEFAHHLFRSYNFQEEFYRFGKGIVADLWSTRYAEMKNIVVPIVPHEEQKAIASFLDQETARIDNLIAEKQTFINLLKEKRQALISHVVTKGLDPNVKMKDSGIEWIGDVPEHWLVQPLKFMAELIDGDRGSNYPSDSDIKDNGVPFVSSKNIVNFRLTKNKLQYITLEKYESLGRGKLTQGDLVITVRGTIGHVALFDSDVIGHETGFINAQMMIIRPTLISAKFLQFYSESISWKTQLDIASYGTAVKQLSNKVLQMVHVAVPSNSEIEEIVSRIETETGVIEEIANETQRSIDLLKEHRAALISAAVTGKIDVRNYKEKAA